MPRTRVEGTTLIVGRTRVDLRFLRTFRGVGLGGETTARVKVHCRGCRRELTVARVGLRVTEDDGGRAVVDLQPYCVTCREALNAKSAG